MPAVASRILHLTDASTPSDSFDMLAALLADADDRAECRLLALGHRSTQLLADQAGIGKQIEWLPSVGWADPNGWRAVRQAVAEFEPTHIHAWGMSAIVAAAFSGTRGGRIATFTEAPSRGQLRMLRWVDARASDWRWVASSATIQKTLVEGGLREENVRCVWPAVGGAAARHGGEVAALRAEMEIEPSDGPILLLGGEGPAARHDFGLWAAAILQQLVPQARVMVREDPRSRPDPGFDRFLNALPQERIIAIARPEIHWRQLLCLADVLLLTPDQGCGIASALHAMAEGVPVVGTPVPGVRELIEDGENGLLAKGVKPRAIAARLEELLNDAAMQKSLAARARVKVTELFSMERMREEYARVHAGAGALGGSGIAVG